MTRSTLLLALAALTALANTALAISGYSGVATPGKPAAAQPGWPVGIVDVVNDECRTVGWNFWFSECPNDVNHYAFAAKSTDDLNRLLKRLAATKAEGICVQLALGSEYPARGFSFLKPGNGIPAVLAFGNQVQLNEWYSRLEEVEPGVRKFGVHRYTEPPTAIPPTLTIYVEHPAVDLAKLVVPDEIIATASISTKELRAAMNIETLKAIDRLLERRRTKE